MRRSTSLLIAIVLLGSTNVSCAQNRGDFENHPPQRVETLPDESHIEELHRSRQTAITRAVAAAAPAVVSINVIELQTVRVRDPYSVFSDPWFDQLFPRRYRQREVPVQGLGSGFVVSADGYIVTNDHVAGRATKITVSFPDGVTLDARLIGTDPASDLALLKVEPDHPLPYLAFTEDDQVIVGEWVIALGNPFGLFEAAEPTVTVGVVSASARDLQSDEQGRIYRDMIQTDAAINHGNSGGPLVNALGEVIGVNTAIVSPSGGSAGVGFAVPASKARRIIEELRVRGEVDRSYYVGLHPRDVNQPIARALRLRQAKGVLVMDIDPNSPAADAGILPYDVIVSISGEEVTNVEDYRARIFDFRPGDVVSVQVIREGELRELQLTIGRQQG